MAVNYQEQYEPHQLEPFWPNEINKMVVVVLCTLATIMFLAILPILLEMIGVHGVGHHEEPANPQGATPVGIKPEWYFLAVYQYLKLMPTQILGISGKTLGVLSQGPAFLLILFLPFWYRRRAAERPSWTYRTVITVVMVAFLLLTLWGGWPEKHVDGEEQLIPLKEYMATHPLTFSLMGASLAIFYVMIAHERQAIRRILYTSPGDSEGGSS